MARNFVSYKLSCHLQQGLAERHYDESLTIILMGRIRIVTHVSFDGIRVEDELIESDGAKETQEQGQLLEPPSIKC